MANYINNLGQTRLGWRGGIQVTASTLLSSIYGVWNAETSSTTLATGAYGAWNGEGIISSTQLSASMSNAWQGGNNSFPATNYSNITASMSNLWKAETSGSYLDSSLSNYWSLNNTANAGVGSVNGTWVGTPDYVSITDGPVAALPNAAHGTADRYISLPDNSLKITSAFSVSGYFAVQTGGTHCIISSLGSSSNGYNNGWSVYCNGNLNFQIGNNGTFVSAVVSGIGGLGYIYQFTATYNPGVGISLYVKSKSQNINSSTFTSTTMTIGYESTQRAALMSYRYGTSNADYKIYGYVSGINIFNKVLNSADVDALYNLGTYTTYPYSSLTLPTTKDTVGDLVGTSPSGSAPTFTTGKVGTYALLFDGVNDFIKLPVGSLQFTGDFTISLWFKPSTLRNGDILLTNYCLRSSDYNRFGWEITLGNGTKINFTQANNNVFNTTLTSSVGPVAGVWQLLTIVRTAATSKMYLNGSLVGQVANTISLAYNTNSVPTIGAETYITWSDNTTSTNGFYNGAIDEIGMWNRGLTENEVTGLYEAGNGQTYPYSNSTTVVSDSYGTSYGILRGGATYSTGKIGNALSFNGSSYVDLKMGTLSKTSDFSISLWVYPTANNQMTLISSHDSQKGWYIQYYSGSLWFWGSNGSLGATPTIQVHTGHSITLNTWTHVLVTVKSNVQVKTYINGALTNTVSIVNKPISYDYYSPYYLPLIGAQRYFNGSDGNSATRDYFTGKLDAIALWDRELTADEASAIYNSGNGNEYPFSNASVSNPSDSVSTNHGTNVSGVTYTTGVVGNAFTFNGSNYINLPNDSLNSTVGNDFSVSLWVNFTSTSNQGLMSNLTNPSVNIYTGWDLRLTSGLPTFNLWNTSGSPVVVQGSAISINNWYHIVITRKKGSRSRIYMNGSLAQSNSNTSDPTISSTYYPNIGHFQYLSTNGANTATYHGLYMASGSKIDAVTVWNKELAEDEITQLYNMGGGIQYPFTTQTIKTPYSVYNGDSLIDPIGARNATIVGGVTYGTGKIGNAYTFDGSTGYLTLPANSMRFAGNFSISFWVYPTAYPTIAQGQIGIISNASLGYGDGYEVFLYNNGSNSISLYSNFGTANGNSTFPIQLNMTPPPLNTWTLVTITFESKVGVKGYYNGELYNSVSSSITALLYSDMPSTYTPTIGYRTNATGPGVGVKFAGKIDSLTFWDSTLTPPEILTMFNDGAGMEYPYSSSLPAKLPSFNDVFATNHGTSPATAAPSFTVGKFGKAFKFDGVNDHILLPSTALKFTGDFSVSLWVYIPIDKTSNQTLIGCLRQPSGWRGWDINIYSNRIYFEAADVSSLKSYAYITSDNIGSWKHVVATFKNGTGGKLYVDNVLRGSFAMTNPIAYDSTDTPTIGCMNYAPGTTWFVQNGLKMDAISTWTRELSATEITELYNSGNGKQYPY